MPFEGKESFQASEGSLPKGSCDVIMPSEGKVSFQASEGSMPKGSFDVTSAMWQWYRSVSSWKSRRPNGNVSYCVEQESRGPSYAFIRLWRAEGFPFFFFVCREMQRNYVALEACANRVLGITQAPEASASGRVGPSGFGTVVVAPVDVGVPVGVPLPKKNMMSLYELESLKVDYAIPECVGLRLGYAPGQYNPNFWCILHGVYIAWWLAKRGEPSFEQFMHLQQGNFGWVQVNCRKAKERGYFIGQPPSSQKTWRNRWFFAFGDWECWPGQTVSNHVPTHFQSIGPWSVKCRPVSREEEEDIELVRRLVPQEARELKNIVTPALLLQSGLLQGMAEVPKKVVTVLEDSPKEGDELLAELEKKRRGLESSIHDVMGGTVLPPFDLDPPPRLPLKMEELFPAGTEDTDFASVRWEAKELARTKATDFSDRVQKTVLSTANVTRAEREVALARRHSETAKAATAEAQAALRERNALQLKVGRLERELKETSRRLEAVEEARLETERRRTEELDAARAEAVEEYKGSEGFKNLVLDAMVEEQYGWEKMVARFNPELDINFDTSGVPPPIPSGRESLFAATPSAEATSPSEAEMRGGADASGGESTLDADAAAEEEADDRPDA
ncbi:unnamed protein product [Prunus brigantina]